MVFIALLEWRFGGFAVVFDRCRIDDKYQLVIVEHFAL